MILQPSPAAEWANVDARLFEEVIKPRGRPAILRGVVGNWPAVAAGRTSPEAMRQYLGAFYTGHAAPLFEAPPSVQGRFFYNENITGFNFESKRELLSTVLDRLCREVGNPQAPAIYSGSVSLPESRM